MIKARRNEMKNAETKKKNIKNIKKKWFYYILLTHTDMKNGINPTNKDTEFFPGHVFIVDKYNFEGFEIDDATLEKGQLDVGWLVLKKLEKLGLVWDLIQPENLPVRSELKRIDSQYEN